MSRRNQPERGGSPIVLRQPECAEVDEGGNQSNGEHVEQERHFLHIMPADPVECGENHGVEETGRGVYSLSGIEDELPMFGKIRGVPVGDETVVVVVSPHRPGVPIHH